MSKVFFDIGVSLDGFMAGENSGPQNPLGDGGPTIHQWMYQQKAWREPQGMKGGEEGPDNSLLKNLNSSLPFSLRVNECLRKVNSIGRKIYIKLQSMSSHTNNESLGSKKVPLLFTLLMMDRTY